MRFGTGLIFLALAFGLSAGDRQRQPQRRRQLCHPRRRVRRSRAAESIGAGF
jgi:hypothetical protein